MPIKFWVDAEKRVRYAVASGVVTDADILGGFGSAVDDLSYDPSLDQLIDATGITRMDISPAALQQLAQLMAVRSDRVLPPGARPRVAGVAASDAAFGMMRMYATYRELQQTPVHYRIFRTVDEATRWLALPEGATSDVASGDRR